MIEIGGLSTLVHGSEQEAQVVVVILHGYAMRPDELAPFASSLGVPAIFYFPQGPRRVRSGGFSWWTINRLRVKAARARGPRDLFRQHPGGRVAARGAITRFMEAIDRVRNGRPVLLGGFSQGGMLACDFVLHEGAAVHAMALMSSSRIAFDEWQPRLGRLRSMPILVAHGTHDPDLAFAAGSALCESFSSAGARTTWLPFDGGHEIPLPVWRALRRVIKELIAEPAA